MRRRVDDSIYRVIYYYVYACAEIKIASELIIAMKLQNKTQNQMTDIYAHTCIRVLVCRCEGRLESGLLFQCVRGSSDSI